MSIWTTLLGTAIHAPSPHNVQPWRVRILSDTQAELLIEKRRTLPKEDVTGSFIILTMGLFIEALHVAAKNRGFTLRDELHQALSCYTAQRIERTDEDLLPFARLTLDNGNHNQPDHNNHHRVEHKDAHDEAAEATYPDSLFFKRRTSRLSLLPDAVPAADVRALSELAARHNQRYEQVTDARTIERVLARNIAAVFDDMNTADYHDELVRWFRFTKRSAEHQRDGLDYRCMNSNPLAFWSAARFPKLLKLPVARALLRRTYRAQLGTVPTIGMLAGAFWQPEDAFATGRFLLRFWLETARRNLYIHPYGNLVTNAPAARACFEMIGVPDVWLIFKIGYSDEPPKSLRRSVADVLLD